MLALRPLTLEGYRALALAVIECCWMGDVQTPEGPDEEGLMARAGACLCVEKYAAGLEMKHPGGACIELGP